jgi:O-antigen/teichoic acid export membrane protein
MERTRKATWGFLSGLAFTVITVIVGLGATPLLFRWLGAERFGAFRAANDWIGHLMIFDVGLSWALVPLFTRALGRGDARAVRAILRGGMRVYLEVALVMLATGAGLALIIFTFIPVSPAVAPDLKRGCWVGLLAFLVVPLSPFRALAEADQRGYLINLLLIVQTMVVTGLGLLLAWFGWGITGQFVAASLGLYPLLFFLLRDGLRRYPKSGGSGTDAPCSADLRRQIWKLNRPSIVLNACGRVGLFTDNLLIAYFLGPATVATFYLTQRTCVLAQSQLLGLGTSGWAGLVELVHKGQKATFHRRLIELTGLVTMLGVAAVVPLAAFNQTFISLWVGPECYGGGWITTLAGINGTLLSIYSLWGLVLSGTGNVARVLPGMVASAAVNIGMSILATIFLGPTGPLVGTLFAFITVHSWYLPLLLRRVFQVPLRPLCLAVAAPALLGIPYALVVRWFAHTHPPEGWISLSLAMASSALIYLAVAWVAIFKADERAVWILRLRMFLRPRATV